jgi:hypothetical protein
MAAFELAISQTEPVDCPSAGSVRGPLPLPAVGDRATPSPSAKPAKTVTAAPSFQRDGAASIRPGPDALQRAMFSIADALSSGFGLRDEWKDAQAVAARCRR